MENEVTTTHHAPFEDTRDLRPVNDIYPLPDNPRHGDVGAISESLRRFGQQKPIVVNSEGVILAGNHTYHAAVALGWTEIWVVESELEGSEQTGFSLADNRLSDLATYDHDMLLGQLDGLDLQGIGYDTDDVDDLRELVKEPLWADEGGLPDAGSSPTATRTFHIPRDKVGIVDEAIDTTRDGGTAGEALVRLLDK